jgi:type I restriction enzyme, R subunit
MQDHGLFQAICRVNRLDGEDKEYGHINDYRDLFKSLEKSVHDYTSEAFEGYEKEDVEGLLTNRLERAKEHLDEKREEIKALCEPVEPPKDTAAYLRYFCARDTTDEYALKDNEPKRVVLYKLTASLIRAYANLANEMLEAGYTEQEAMKIKEEVEYYEKVRSEVKLASGDYIDLKMFEPAMRHLLDTYIRAEESEKISAFDDMTLVQLIVERGMEAIDTLPSSIRDDREAVAETIENNVRRLIIDEHPTNPKYYEKMSQLLDNLILERRLKAIEYQHYLTQIVEIAKLVENPIISTSYPPTLNTSAKRALYDNLGNNDELALAIDRDIRETRRDSWRGNRIKEREVRYAIRKHLQEDAEVDRIFELVRNQREY